MSYDNAINAERIKNQMKNKTLGIVMSCILPGAGHIYSGSPIKGIIIMILFIACMVTSFLIAPLFIAFILWLWGMFSVNKEIIAFNEALLTSELNQTSPQ
ncbi:hypothetical protein [Photobacterium sanguinicancri]|uniref:hypothetical protein n=1 Tax=Photobacterium sanguinicancri TaxID=875932 RepID=UPI0021C311DE|nr:hypothetical protein [Photobacterium sanguinicancri]